MSYGRSGSKWRCRDIPICLLHWCRRPCICPDLRRGQPLETLSPEPRLRSPARRAASSSELPNPGQHLPAEQFEVGDSVLVAQKTALAHHQEVPEAADMVVK